MSTEAYRDRQYPCGVTRREFAWEMGRRVYGTGDDLFVGRNRVLRQARVRGRELRSTGAKTSTFRDQSEELHFLDDEWRPQSGRYLRLQA